MDKRGQSIVEFGLLIIVIVAAVIATQVYLKRGIQGRLRDNVDAIGEQYDPGATSSEFTASSVSNSTTTTKVEPKQVAIQNCDPGGMYGCTSLTFNATVTTATTETHYANTSRTGYEIVGKP